MSLMPQQTIPVGRSGRSAPAAVARQDGATPSFLPPIVMPFEDGAGPSFMLPIMFPFEG